jgi:hypothetical protein
VASDSAHITSGVTQGLVLEPLLFCSFINDILEVMRHCKYHTYADDFQLYISGKYDVLGDCFAILNDDLALNHRWSMSNGLLLNPNKAMFICRFRATVAPQPVVVAGVTIPYSSKVCDLGMTLNDRQMFDDHINDLCSRVHYRL